MKFADFVSVGSIKADLAAEDKPGVISELVNSLAQAGAINPAEVEGSSPPS
jgi:mannitol/fructose-specific phosphotransferase system IIA component (Ntr-type)